MRIAVGGFHHETNTFAPVKTDLLDFEQQDAWPGLARGESILDAVVGMNIPMSGFLQQATRGGNRILPLLWCSATPAAHVTESAFETISGMLIDDLRAEGPVDAVYLDLHGAMVTEHLDDGEGELLRRVRAVIGDKVPVVVSLDLHANVTAEMAELATVLVAYRTYPHVDMEDTGRRAALLLDRSATIRGRAMRKLPFLIPLIAQCTLAEPMARIMAHVASTEVGPILSASFLPGFPPADIAQCGPTLLVYAEDVRSAERCATELSQQVESSESEFSMRLFGAEEAVDRAVALVASGRRPIVLADTQDNPGAGGNSDTIGLLATLLRRKVSDAVIGLIYDPEVARAAHSVGVGAPVQVSIGAKSGFPGETPLEIEAVVEALGDGRMVGTGPYYRGCSMALGPMALLRVDDVRIVVSSRKLQAADQAPFRHLGVEPATVGILALKSSVHFRAEFGPLTAETMTVLSPGPNVADPAELPYRNLRRGVRLRPNGPAFGAQRTS